jgi:peptidoglycan/xylan/chitin deacetylase (PgdA/CDA1 family)
MRDTEVVDTYKQITSYWPWWARARGAIRNVSIFLRSRSRRIERTTDWIQFPFYHHVFEDERRGFSRQIEYLKNFGEFISLDHVVEMLGSGERIAGRYFCITFDDGIDGCSDHAFQILAEMDIPGAFFVMPSFMGGSKGKEGRVCKPIADLKFSVRCFTWEECREMADAGMVIGSHTCSHARLSELTDDQVFQDLRSSKETIERELGRPCNHFSCPWGRPGIDFHRDHHERIAREVGYKSFLTTQKGAMRQGDSPYFMKRCFVYANSGNYMLRHLFGR